MLSTVAFLFFIVLPAIAIFAYVSRVTSGIYHWADRQHPQPNYEYPMYSIETTHTTIHTTQTPEAQYLGHSEKFEDSREFAELLDSKRFDVRDYLK